ncbi:MAG: hypothetical protein IJK99_06885 [Bacteroidales bacterium]|nr:hypothetical protein [Bacteroidales bacterium]
MRASGTLKFFAAVVALLALLCIVFPRDGIAIGGVVLRFPTLHKVLVREKEKSMDQLLVKREERDLSGLRDSIAECRHIMFEGQTRFWLPDDDVSCFDRFFEKAEKAQKQGRIVRVLHYGDSQIEQDRISCRLRERLQMVFGGGGPGMLPLRQPIPTISFNQSTTGAIQGLSTYGDSTFSRSNGNYGPMLRCWRLTGGATMSLYASKGNHAAEKAGRFSSIKVLYNNRPGPLSVSMHNRKGAGDFSASSAKPGIGLLSWQMDTVTSSASLTLSGTADIYGILVDDGYGVAVDNISMRGVSGHQFKMVNFDQLAESYRLLDIGMIIMQFGGNSVPYLKNEKTIDNYCKHLGEQIDFVRRACPEAVILFVGPSDMSTKVGGQLATYPMLPTVVEKLREMANAHGAAYWSIYDAMGGHNSMITWVKNGYAGPDYIHFTHKGARIMGDYLSDALHNVYELYKIRQQITNQQFNELWNNLTTTDGNSL